ncbi:GIY-YIG nuclease family protein [Staphylococcus sp. 17KM0847]|uniref:GIY-YIG nuclease family protein n=1 Tax=Staphylococcus sp. 17KM0847 TaxID=2583989 RepID=UPI0015DD4556|nr:GIY-YIG nuclease family protein [Staphylococcus sp. 17KM0847]QLK85284.1 GIY-YIG nuclease family protein [Staphylococcus sp. 17KM0847]
MVKHYTYIVECCDHTLYTGYTNDLNSRIHKHNEGKGAKYTKTRRPVRLKYYETYDTKSEALKREYAIKQLTRQQKIALIEER